MGICKGDDDNIFSLHLIDDDVRKALHDALPQIGGNQFPSQRKMHYAGNAGLKLGC